MNKTVRKNALILLSYLSVLCRTSFPFFHRLIAGGEAWGLHSNVTSLPERAFSKASNGLWEKLGADAVCFGGQRKTSYLKKKAAWVFTGHLSRTYRFFLQLQQFKILEWTQHGDIFGSDPYTWFPIFQLYGENPPPPSFGWLTHFVNHHWDPWGPACASRQNLIFSLS